MKSLENIIINDLGFTLINLKEIQPILVVKYLHYKYNWPYSEIYQIINDKKILVNNKKINCFYKLKSNDSILIKLKKLPHANTEHNLNIYQPKNFITFFLGYEDFLKKIIIYEDENFICINKPIGWSTQGGINCQLNIDDLLSFYKIPHYILHRLDKATSGVLLLGKTLLIAQKMGKLFKNHKIKKKYLAVIPKTQMDVWEVESYIGDINENINKKNNSKTIFKSLKNKNNYSLIKATPVTGKKHQIRIHCKEKGLPIVGDDKYNGIKGKRLYLHSSELSFVLDGKKYKFFSECEFENLEIN